MIYFNEADHTYRLDDPINGELCISATKFIGLFKSEYDEEFWSWYTALRYALGQEKKDFSLFLIKRFRFSFRDMRNKTTIENKKDITEIAYACGVTVTELETLQAQVKVEWKAENRKSQIKGTAFHNFKEGEIYKDAGLEFEGVFAHLTEDVDDLSILHDPHHIVIAPELRMFNRDYLISGTADKVYIFPDKTFIIDDWKTNKRIKIENKYDKMKAPISHLDDCNFNHYKLQVSLYAWLLEQWGYKCKGLRFTHVDIDENNNILNQVEYHVHYMKKEIEAMLAHYKENKQQLLGVYYE